MKKLLVVFFLGAIYPSNAEEKVDAQSILAVAKVTGACGIMKQMAEFQQSTKMPGGDEFMVRFWTTEAARLGKTIQEYGAACLENIIVISNKFESFPSPAGGGLPACAKPKRLRFGEGRGWGHPDGALLDAPHLTSPLRGEESCDDFAAECIILIWNDYKFYDQLWAAGEKRNSN